MMHVMGQVKGLSRKERAARTRRAIVAAATGEFRESGYHGTTMAAIAKRAGVAVQTVYFVFHTKPLLLTAAIDDAVMGPDEPTPPELTAWWQEETTATDTLAAHSRSSWPVSRSSSSGRRRWTGWRRQPPPPTRKSAT